jgi:hypothetical protein
MTVAQYTSVRPSHPERPAKVRRPPATQAYLSLLAAAIAAGKHASFEIRGGCMWPALRAGDRVRVSPLRREPRIGDVLVCYRGIHAVAHRVVQHFRDAHGDSWVRCRGDAALTLDAPVRASEVLGLVDEVERAGSTLPPPPAAALSSRLVAPLRTALCWLRAKQQARR